MYGGIFFFSNPLGNYEQSKFFRLVAKLKIVHNFPMDLNWKKSHRTSSLFHLLSKTKLPDQSFSIPTWTFSGQFFQIFDKVFEEGFYSALS